MTGQAGEKQTREVYESKYCPNELIGVRFKEETLVSVLNEVIEMCKINHK